MYIATISFSAIPQSSVHCCVTTSGNEVKALMATYGKVRPLNPKSDEWDIYEEQLSFYLVANNITDQTKKHSILLMANRPSKANPPHQLTPKGSCPPLTVSVSHTWPMFVGTKIQSVITF